METCNYEVLDELLVVSLNVELDHHNEELIRDEIDKMIDIEEKKNVVFDFTKVNFMDSSGIGVIMGRYRKVYYMASNLYSNKSMKIYVCKYYITIFKQIYIKDTMQVLPC